MLLNGKPIDAIDEQDLLALVGTDESRTLDFKKTAYQAPPSTAQPPEIREKWKRDLCADVCSFANASGGWIICGMKEKDGTADELCGLGAINTDAEIRRLRECIDAGVQPKIPGLLIKEKELPTTGKGYAIVIYIPKSFVSPHWMKETQEFHKFYIRRDRNNSEMDLSELRAAFNLSESYVAQIRTFHRERINLLANDNQEGLPIILDAGVRLSLHIIPLSFADTSSKVDLSVFQAQHPADWLGKHNLMTYPNYGRFNFDGFIRPNGTSTTSQGYRQIFRNGTMEFVDVVRLIEQRFIDIRWLETIILKNLDEAWIIQKNLGVETPLIMFVSLLGVKDKRFAIHVNGFYEQPDNQPRINQDRLLVPGEVIGSFEQNPKTLLRHIFDILWNSGGWQRSFSYDDNGSWIRVVN